MQSLRRLIQAPALRMNRGSLRYSPFATVATAAQPAATFVQRWEDLRKQALLGGG